MSGEACPFCDMRLLAPLAENGLAYALRDRAPVRPLHTLIIPRRHIANIFEATGEELQALHELALEVRSAILLQDPSVQGFNFWLQHWRCGRTGDIPRACPFDSAPRRRHAVVEA
jgi:diadenosine tetraphosphate (Ap4A) HIT family hydrolase